MSLATLKPRLATENTSRAPILQPGSWRTDKQTSTQRGYGYAWQKARAGHLRSHPLCVYCEREGRTTLATVVDHRVPHRGDQALFWNQKNWDSLCANHHSSAKQREEKEAEALK